MSKPSPSSYPAYFSKYINLVPEVDLLTAFENQLQVINEFLSKVTEERSTYAYAEGKWTLKELLQHITDTERIFCYRALCFARKEKSSLPGFDENDYAASSQAGGRTWQSLSEEFLAVRESTLLLFKSFTVEALNSTGISNNNPMSVSAAGFIISGHFYHHRNIVEERYLV